MNTTKKILKKEVAVAFLKNTQPVWFRVTKYILLSIVVYFTGTQPFFWWMIAALFVLSLVIHFCYRYKTKGWTKSFGMWNYEKFARNKQN
jgi:magnesium-transporting ATPase (P-type)